jgi:hypothetical protein
VLEKVRRLRADSRQGQEHQSWITKTGTTGLKCRTFFFLGLGASAGASAALGASAFFSAAGAGAAASGAGAACERASVIGAWSSRVGKKGEGDANGNGEENGHEGHTERTKAWAYTCARESSRQERPETTAQRLLLRGTFFFLGLGASAGASAALGASAGAGAAASGAGAACERAREIDSQSGTVVKEGERDK